MDIYRSNLRADPPARRPVGRRLGEGWRLGEV